MTQLYFVLVDKQLLLPSYMCLIVMIFTNLCLIYQPGKAIKKGLRTYTITPESLLLCHNGKVKFSLHPGKKNLSNSNRNLHSYAK